MFIPFDMIAAMLFIGFYAETPAADPPSALAAGAVLGGFAVGLALCAALLNFLTLRRLRRSGPPHSRRRALALRTEMLARCLLVAAYVAAMFASDFPWSVGKALGLTLTPEAFALQMLALAPYLLLFFALWLPLYRLHRETTPGTWTRRSYVVHKARYNLYMLLAWLPFALAADWFEEALALLPALFLLAAWTFPALLARAWGCVRLREGETLETVRRMEKLAGVRFSRVYLWEPGGGGQNAAAVGVMRPFRFLFLTPSLIRNMSPDELEAVILHELGHAKKHHLVFYLFTSLAGINAAVLSAALLPLGPTERFLLTAALVLGYFRFVFGWLSRNMERQADLFALEKGGGSRGLANALEKLGLAAGNVRLASSWHHLGIAERVEYLRRAELRPELARGHNRFVAAVMVAGYASAALAIGGIVWTVRLEASRPAEPPAAAVANRGQEAHWRRVMRLMPGNALAPLELAYRLAGRPDRHNEAAALADEAARLSRGREEREAAEKLLRDLKEETPRLKGEG